MAGGDSVEKIKERLSILDVVAPYVELHKAGKSYKGKSPFTNEKTPSFFVSPDKGMYYCFSSNQGGDMFTFIEKLEGVDFRGALTILAEKAGVELTPEDPKKRTEREALYALLEEAAKYFFKNREGHAEADRYVKDRGVKGETVHIFRIGYALPEWRALRMHLSEQGFSDELMLKAGLIKKPEGGKEPYDVFRDRVMFPICDPSGRVVAFSGRILAKDTDAPKYVNSPETELFEKSKVLYGYDKAKEGIRKFDFTLLVEGQFDVVMSHQAGYTNTVAISGTAYTNDHAALLQRLSGRAVLALDSDRAGVASAKRAAELMLARGMDTKVARFPEGKDPADIINDDPKEFKKLIGGATHVIEFLLAVLRENAKDDRTYKLRVREEVLSLLVRMPSRIDREHFEGVVANAIAASTDSVHHEVERLIEDAKSGRVPAGGETTKAEEEPQAPRRARKDELVRHLFALTLVLEDTELTGVIERELKARTDTETLRALGALGSEEQSRLIFTTEAYLEEVPRRALHEEIEDKLTELMHLAAKEELRRLRDAVREAEAAGDAEKANALLGETMVTQKQLQERITVTAHTNTDTTT